MRSSVARSLSLQTAAGCLLKEVSTDRRGRGRGAAVSIQPEGPGPQSPSQASSGTVPGAPATGSEVGTQQPQAAASAAGPPAGPPPVLSRPGFHGRTARAGAAGPPPAARGSFPGGSDVRVGWAACFRVLETDSEGHTKSRHACKCWWSVGSRPQPHRLGPGARRKVGAEARGARVMQHGCQPEWL